MEETNRLKTYKELDAELDILEEKYKEKQHIKYVVIVLIILFIFSKPIIFKIKYAFPRVSGHTQSLINPYQEPIQKDILTDLTKRVRLSDFMPNNIEEDQQTSDLNKEIISNINSINYPEAIKVKTLDETSEVKLIPMAEYSISGRTVAINHTFTFFRNKFDNVALIDIGLVWGNLSPTEFIKKYLKFDSQKIYLTGSRRLATEWKSDTPLPPEYIQSHLSHTHIIPANSNILSALLKLKIYDLVKMDGLLVDIYTQKMHIAGSLSRNDSNETSRGNGACEIMYVKKVQIGDRIYE